MPNRSIAAIAAAISLGTIALEAQAASPTSVVCGPDEECIYMSQTGRCLICVKIVGPHIDDAQQGSLDLLATREW